MPAYTQENEQEFKAMIRLLMVRNPDVTILKMQDALRQNGYELDKDYINRLMKNIREERTKHIDTQLLSEEVAKFEDLIKALANELWKIILDKDKMIGDKIIKGPTRKDKTEAIKALIDANQKLFNTKFDAGIFTKHLGKLKTEGTFTPEEQALIDQAIKYATGRAHKSKSERDSERPEKEKTTG